MEAEVYNVDLDIDADGLMTSYEEEIGTNPESADSDGDGYDDGDEIIRASTLSMKKTIPTLASINLPKKPPAPRPQDIALDKSQKTLP